MTKRLDQLGDKRDQANARRHALTGELILSPRPEAQKRYVCKNCWGAFEIDWGQCPRCRHTLFEVTSQ